MLSSTKNVCSFPVSTNDFPNNGSSVSCGYSVCLEGFVREKVQHEFLTVSLVQPVSGVDVGAGAGAAEATAGATGE